MAIKVVEQAIEADAHSKFNRHLGGHDERIRYAERYISEEVSKNIKELFFIYGRLGYDGRDGIRARRAIALINNILKELEKRWGEKLGIEHPERP